MVSVSFSPGLPEADLLLSEERVATGFDKLAKQVRSSSALAVFVTDNDDRAHWVKSGRSYQRFALKATTLGLQHAFVNQPLDVPKKKTEFARLLGIEAGRPDLMVRIGYGNAMPK